jgi:hypothetical protein
VFDYLPDRKKEEKEIRQGLSPSTTHKIIHILGVLFLVFNVLLINRMNNK